MNVPSYNNCCDLCYNTMGFSSSGGELGEDKLTVKVFSFVILADGKVTQNDLIKND